jgi:hypothetical protein
MLRKPNHPELVRIARVRQLWQARSRKVLTTTDLVNFHGWLRDRYPDLLPLGKQGHQYQHLKMDLKGLIEGE